MVSDSICHISLSFPDYITKSIDEKCADLMFSSMNAATVNVAYGINIRRFNTILHLQSKTMETMKMKLSFILVLPIEIRINSSVSIESKQTKKNSIRIILSLSCLLFFYFSACDIRTSLVCLFSLLISVLLRPFRILCVPSAIRWFQANNKKNKWRTIGRSEETDVGEG